MTFLPDVNMDMSVLMEQFVDHILAMCYVTHVPWKSAIGVQLPTLRLRLLTLASTLDSVDSAVKLKH